MPCRAESGPTTLLRSHCSWKPLCTVMVKAVGSIDLLDAFFRPQLILADDE